MGFFRKKISNDMVPIHPDNDWKQAPSSGRRPNVFAWQDGCRRGRSSKNTTFSCAKGISSVEMPTKRDALPPGVQQLLSRPNRQTDAS